MGVFILFFLNKILDNSLSMAKLEDKTPECVYGYFNDSNIVIVEWPEILSDIIPRDAIKIEIKHKK